MHKGLRAAALLVAIASVACGDDSPTSPTQQPFTLTGNWTGDVTVLGAPARMTWTLNQSGNAVTGPAIVTLPNGVVLLNAAVAGTLTGTTFSYTMTATPGGVPSEPACGGQLGGTATATTGSPATLSGTYQLLSSTCAAPFGSGTFLLRR